MRAAVVPTEAGCGECDLPAKWTLTRGSDRFMTHPGQRELAEVVVDLRQEFRGTHFLVTGFFASGYFARSARHFLTSSGLIVAV